MDSNEPFSGNGPNRESSDADTEMTATPPAPVVVNDTPWWAVPSQTSNANTVANTNASTNEPSPANTQTTEAIRTETEATQPDVAPVNPGSALVTIVPDDLSVAGPMNNLPHIRPQELKIIGRCVCFVADCLERGEPRDYYFQGMVSQITKDTVTMIEVLKFTVDGFYEFRNKATMIASLSGSEGQNAQIAAIGAPLPRRGRRSGQPSASQSASTMPNQQQLQPSGPANNGTYTIFTSPMALPTPTVMAANNFSHGVISEEASATEPALYDYAEYNRANYYDNSSTMMPGPRPPTASATTTISAPGGTLASRPYAIRHPLFDQISPSNNGRPVTESLFTVIPNASSRPGGWTRDQPLAHYKFMTFARRKIRKVEFSTDHPMAGLLQPYYVSHYFKPHWEPNSHVPTSTAPDAGEHTGNAPDGDTATATPADGASPNTQTLAPHQTPVENTRKAKERAKLRWKEQQIEDRPIPLPVTGSHPGLTGLERDTSHPFMGINLKCVDPIGYRQRRHAYKTALKAFFESNSEARALAPNAIRKAPLSSYGASPLGGRLAAGELEPTTVTTTAAASPYGDESSLNSDSSDEEEEALTLASSVAARGGGAGRLVSSDSQHGPLSPPTVAIGPRHRREASRLHQVEMTSRDVAAAAADGNVVTLRDVDPATLLMLVDLGAPPKPPLYESPQSLQDIYSNVKWRANPYLLQDLERVRMFLRRFLVHTSQGNNQKRIPLLTFVAQRCPWPNPSESLLRELLYEDLHTLLKVEAELVAKSQNGDTRNRNNGDINPAFIGTFGEEINPGRVLLASTGVTARTTYIAIAHIALSIGLLLYAASAFSSLEKFFVSQYANNTAAWVVAAAACHLFLGAASGFHSMKMQVPFIPAHAVPRMLMQAITLALLILCFIQVIMMIVSDNNILKGITQRQSWLNLAAEGNQDLCNFMVRYACSGYDMACDADPNQCIGSCWSAVSLYGDRCEKSVSDSVADSLLPILVLVSLCGVAVVVDLLYMWRYVVVVRRLQGA